MLFVFDKNKVMLDLSKIRVVEDFPKKGIKFFDITTVLNNAQLYRETIDELVEIAKQEKPDVLVALETRGFFFGPSIALALNIPFIPIRKAGKLPWETYRETYHLEYGDESIEIHTDAMQEGKRVLIFDDILATGGTSSAAIQLCKHFNPSYIGVMFLLEIAHLKGRDKITADSMYSLIKTE